MEGSLIAEDEKRIVWEQIQAIRGDLVILGRSRDWRGKKDKSLSVFLTFSKYYDYSKSYWYNINTRNITKWLEHKESFVVFVAGDHRTTFITPAREIEAQIIQSGRHIPASGDFGIHIRKTVVVSTKLTRA